MFCFFENELFTRKNSFMHKFDQTKKRQILFTIVYSRKKKDLLRDFDFEEKKLKLFLHTSSWTEFYECCKKCKITNSCRSQ